jgi:ribosome-associated heat shock protein Hsp15
MRIDKYLWCVRVFKTRTLAAQQCKNERVWINSELIKASRELKLGDIIQVRKGPIHFRFEVVQFPKARIGAKLVNEFIKDVTEKSELEKLEQLKLQQRNTPYFGIGRPTKRDRRMLDDFLFSEDSLDGED